MNTALSTSEQNKRQPEGQLAVLLLAGCAGVSWLLLAGSLVMTVVFYLDRYKAHGAMEAVAIMFAAIAAALLLPAIGFSYAASSRLRKLLTEVAKHAA